MRPCLPWRVQEAQPDEVKKASHCMWYTGMWLTYIPWAVDQVCSLRCETVRCDGGRPGDLESKCLCCVMLELTCCTCGDEQRMKRRESCNPLVGCDEPWIDNSGADKEYWG